MMYRSDIMTDKKGSTIMKKSIKLSLSLLATTLLFACSPKGVEDIQIGSSKSEVVEIMGDPDYIEINSVEIFRELQPKYEMLLDIQSTSSDTGSVSESNQKLIAHREASIEGMENVIIALSENVPIERYDYMNVEGDEHENMGCLIYMFIFQKERFFSRGLLTMSDISRNSTDDSAKNSLKSSQNTLESTPK